MLNRSFTAVVERNTVFAEAFATEPYETGWAGEARWFVRVLEMAEGTELSIRPQLSPDGLFWCDSEEPGIKIGQPGLYTLKMAEFGHWLSLKGEPLSVRGTSEPSVKLIVYLTLKE